ncbi:MAG: asparaginase domain-containing protein [Acidimicrobiales bacterium]
MADLPKIAVFSGPTATISNSPPLVTSNKARGEHGFDLLPDRFDALRPQRLAAPATVYVEALSAHPLEHDAAELYAPPDGWLDDSGEFHTADPGSGTPVYRVTLEPGDGLYPLPFMGRQADGSPWDGAGADRSAGHDRTRQTFYPDSSRLYEEIDRLGIGVDGRSNLLSSRATFEHFRAAPSGGYRSAPHLEAPGEDYFGYSPFHLRTEPHLGSLARSTNMVQQALNSGAYIGAQWLEGSSTTEETMYWLGLVIDTTVPLVGHLAQRAHQLASADGDRNIIDGVEYLTSGVALDESGRDRVGPVVLVDEVVFAARDAAKTDARPGNFVATGGHGGIVGTMGGAGPPKLTYLPTRRHTYQSEVHLGLMPTEVPAVQDTIGDTTTTAVRVKNETGELLAEAMPLIQIVKFGRYHGPDDELEIIERTRANLAAGSLGGFVAEGMSPYGLMNLAQDDALRIATFSGHPTVVVGRGNTGGMASDLGPLVVSGDNLTATKARMLLMACLLRFGALPPAKDPSSPTEDEYRATRTAIANLQHIFASH